MSTTLTFRNAKAFWSTNDNMRFGSGSNPENVINIPFKVMGDCDNLWSDHFCRACKIRGIDVSVFTKFTDGIEYVLKLTENADSCEYAKYAQALRHIASMCDTEAKTRDDKLEAIKNWKEESDNEVFNSVTASEIIQGTAKIMSDPEAQRKWAEEMDGKGYYISFNGPFPSIGCKEIYLSNCV